MFEWKSMGRGAISGLVTGIISPFLFLLLALTLGKLGTNYFVVVVIFVVLFAIIIALCWFAIRWLKPSSALNYWLGAVIVWIISCLLWLSIMRSYTNTLSS